MTGSRRWKLQPKWKGRGNDFSGCFYGGECMVEKMIKKMESVQAVNQLAAKLKQLGLKKDLEALAEKTR